MGAVDLLHHAALCDCPKHLYYVFGVGVRAQIVFKFAIRILIYPPGKVERRERCSWDREDPGSQTPGLSSSLAPHFNGGCPQRSGECPPVVLLPPLSHHAFRKGGRGTCEVCSGSHSSAEAKMSSSRVSSLLQPTFSTEIMDSVCEDVTSLEEMQLH